LQAELMPSENDDLKQRLREWAEVVIWILTGLPLMIPEDGIREAEIRCAALAAAMREVAK
jgi:hypothetical protein